MRTNEIKAFSCSFAILGILALSACQLAVGEGRQGAETPPDCAGSGGTAATGAAPEPSTGGSTPVNLADVDESTPPDETPYTKGAVAVSSPPAELHSQTHQDCQYARVSRHSEVHPEIRLAGLEETSYDAEQSKIDSTESFKKEVVESLTTSASAELLAGFEAETGKSPTSFGVNVNAKVEKSVAEQMADEWAAVRTRTVITYEYTVTGTIEARLVAEVIDVYDWVGDDCTMQPDPTTYRYTRTGDWQTLAIEPLVFKIYEVTLPGQERGESWADERMRQQLHRTLDRAWDAGPLRTLPSPL